MACVCGHGSDMGSHCLTHQTAALVEHVRKLVCAVDAVPPLLADLQVASTEEHAVLSRLGALRGMIMPSFAALSDAVDVVTSMEGDESTASLVARLERATSKLEAARQRQTAADGEPQLVQQRQLLTSTELLAAELQSAVDPFVALRVAMKQK